MTHLSYHLLQDARQPPPPLSFSFLLCTPSTTGVEYSLPITQSSYVIVGSTIVSVGSVEFSVCVNQLYWRNNWFAARGIQMKRLTITRGAKYDWMPFPLQSIDSLHFTRNSSTCTQCARHCKYDIVQLKLKWSYYFVLKNEFLLQNGFISFRICVFFCSRLSWLLFSRCEHISVLHSLGTEQWPLFIRSNVLDSATFNQMEMAKGNEMKCEPCKTICYARKLEKSVPFW